MLPDLLNASPVATLNVEQSDQAVVFAFSGHASGSLFADALASATLPPSTWQPEVFAEDLFLDTFVRQCFEIRLGGQPRALLGRRITQLLAHPPRERASVEFRRAIIGELLDQPALRAELTHVYEKLTLLRGLLENSSTDGFNPGRRQLDILTAFHALIELLAASFGASQSGLGRLREYGLRVQASDDFRALSDLLRYDERMSTLNVRVALGADGRVRKFELVSVKEDDANQFVNSPLRRWLGKVELLLRGYSFGSGEVLARLLDAVFEGVRPEFSWLIQLFGDIEFYLGALGLADRARAQNLEVCLPTLTDADAPRELLGLFNPLLMASGIAPVPCDLTSDRSDTTLLITGPNSGGKTRLLQSIGLSLLLAHGGLFVPARSARLALGPGLVVSLIQETSVDQTEGRLGMELLRIRGLFERVPPGAIVVLDELCSGTNPSEGEEIFELVLRMLARLRPQAFITTHFLEFAGRLQSEGEIEGLRFVQVALGSNHEPTYQFEPGVATTSLANQAAARLGVTGDQLLALIDQRIAQQKADKD